MACRVGISTNPEARIAHWKQVEGHTYSTILARSLTYDQAQTREANEAKKRDCHSAPGGDPGNDRHRYVWSVYYVSGGTIG